MPAAVFQTSSDTGIHQSRALPSPMYSGTPPGRAYFSSTPGVEFIASCFGRFDLVATLGVSSLDEMYEILDKVRAMASVASVESWLHLRIVQERYAKPLDKMLAMRTHANGQVGGAANGVTKMLHDT